MEFGMPFLLEMETIEDCCALAKELGLSFVELNANFPPCLPECLDPALLHRLMGKYGVYFTLHMEEECDPFSFNSSVRQAWMNSVRRVLSLASALHMPTVNMHFPRGVYVTLPERKAFMYAQYEDELYRGLEAFRAMCEETLADSDVRIGIENTSGWQPYEQRAIEFLLASPVFGLTLDIGHCHGNGNADEPFFRQHAERLIHMHGHDAIGKRDHLALGDGEIDLRERFAWAERSHARIVLETKTIQALRTSVSRLPQIFC